MLFTARELHRITQGHTLFSCVAYRGCKDNNGNGLCWQCAQDWVDAKFSHHLTNNI